MAINLIETRREDEDSYYAVDYDIMLDGSKIGGVGVMTSEKETYVEGIVIDENQRNHGYGTEVLTALSEMHGGIYLAPDNADAQRLYKRIGYEYNGDNAPYVDQGFGVYAI